MKFALQIYGVFRTFEKCLPDILKYIDFESHDFDVFVLSQRADGYSVENENKIRQMLKGRVLDWRYIEDYPSSVHEKEHKLCKEYDYAVSEARRSIQPHFMTNAFVTRLWYRRYLNNEMRKEYEKLSGVKYDWVIRTRFDIGFLSQRNDSLSILSKEPHPSILYAMPDTFSCGCPEVINYESTLIENWPYVYKVFREQGKLPMEFYSRINPSMIIEQFTQKWLFMSEVNLITYFAHSPYRLVYLPPCLQITRRHQAGLVHSTATTSINMVKPIKLVTYGYDTRVIDLTDKFRHHCEKKKFVLGIGNEYAGYDPYPFKVKKLTITFEDQQKIEFDEGSVVEFNFSAV